MPSAEDLNTSNRFMGLFVSRSGAGKTVAACSFRDSLNQKVEVIDFDGRIRGLLGAPWINRKNIHYTYYPPRIRSGASNYEKLNTQLERINDKCVTGQNDIHTLVLDSMTAETFALLTDAIPLTHSKAGGGSQSKGKFIGSMPMVGPEDYGFEASGTYQMLGFLRSLPIPNIIVTAHIVERFGKADPDNAYSESIPVGEKLSIRDKIGENIQIYFDHVFRFEKRMLGIEEKHYVRFRSDIARTAFHGLPNGEVDITGKDFYKYLKETIAGQLPTSAPNIVDMDEGK